jgi:membrane protein DedA with SNARE-associated domain
MPEHMLHWASQYGYFGIFASLLLGVIGLPVPDETLLAFSGYLVWSGSMNVIPALAAGFLGSSCGITTSYLVGSASGNLLMEKVGPFLGITSRHMQLVHDWFGRFGRWTLTFGYFVPGVRHLTAYAAGTSKLPYRTFASFAYLGAFLWTGTFLTAGYLLGAEWRSLARPVYTASFVMTVASVAVALFYLLSRLTARKKSVN